MRILRALFTILIEGFFILLPVLIAYLMAADWALQWTLQFLFTR